MTNKSSKFAGLLSAGGLGLWLALLFSFPRPGLAVDKQALRGHAPEAVAKLNLKPLGRVPGSHQMRLVLGLPLRNQAALTSLLQQLYDPASPNFHRYLEPAQFTERFGPTEEDYQRVVSFANTSGLQVRKTYGDRVLLDVTASVSTIERAFHVTLHTYQHPTEARRFFAPDVEPSVDVDVPVIFISGLNNFSLPRPLGHLKPAPAGGGSPQGGLSGAPFFGVSYRRIYALGVSNTGSGQMVGLVEFQGYYPSDITDYERHMGTILVPNPVPLQDVLCDHFSGVNSADTDGVLECSMDIELVISMAPGLSQVVVFEGDNSVDPDGTRHCFPDPVFSSMASYNQIKQFSCSWAELPYDPMAEGYLMRLASQGQSFFQASGDGGAYSGGYCWPSDDPYVTSVGGTELKVSFTGAGTYYYVSESVWNNASSTTDWMSASGGGVSTMFGIPLWQRNVNLNPVGGSLAMRNSPDVAMVADWIGVIYDQGLVDVVQGTSAAAPLWAGFMALVNQQLAAGGKPPLGFANPALYAIGQSGNYASCFLDITSGNNTNVNSANEYFAAPGYDLCTGWGSPNCANLIAALEAYVGASPGEGVVFVDFNYTGFFGENGRYYTPYKSLSHGVTAVPAGGTIIFKTAGASPETMTISKPMTLNAIGGTATIGRKP